MKSYKRFLTLLSLLAAVVQLNSAFYYATTAYMRRWRAIILALCINSYVQRCFLFTPAHVYPAYVNGHVTCAFRRASLDGDSVLVLVWM